MLYDYNTSLVLTVLPMVAYSNANIFKIQIIKQVKGKSGVYR